MISNMKRYISSAKEIPVGKVVYIKSPDSFYDGEWGVVKYFDGDDYHVAIANGPDCPIFDRSELKVAKNQNIGGCGLI